MALSGTDVVFPMATSAAGLPEWLGKHSQPLWSWDPEVLFRPAAYASRDKSAVGIGWNGNDSYAALFLIDAGFNMGDANRIPPGSVITSVSAQVQIGDSALNPTHDVTVDAALTKRDGLWNNGVSGITFSPFSVVNAVGSGNAGSWKELGGRVFIRIRDFGGGTPNRVLNIKNNQSEHSWIWVAWVRFHAADNLTGRWDGFGDTFDSTYTGQVGNLAMRFRRKTGTLPGTYRFELWSVVSGTNDPDAMLAYTSEANAADITTLANGALYNMDVVHPVSGWQIVSGTRYHVRVSTSGTSSPINNADNLIYPMVGVKPVGLVSSGIKGCTGSGASYAWGNQHWLSQGSYGHRARFPTIYWTDFTEDGIYNDVEPVGGYEAIAVGLSGGTLAPHLAQAWGTWVGLSGNYDPLVAAMQAWIDDPNYTMSGEQAILGFQLGARDFGGNSTVGVSGARLLISWTPDPCDWFTGSGQSWHSKKARTSPFGMAAAPDWAEGASRSTWKTTSGADWFDSQEC